jgi:hypothetical protein
MMLFLLFLLLVSSQAVQGSRAVPAGPSGLFSPCDCPQKQPGYGGSTHAASPISMLVGAVDQKHVLMKVRMLPTSASGLLKTVKAGERSAHTGLLAGCCSKLYAKAFCCWTYTASCVHG